MPFIRKIEHPRRHTQPLQRRKQLQPLTHIQPIVLLRMNHQRRRLRILNRQHRRPLPERISIHRPIRIVPGLRRPTRRTPSYPRPATHRRPELPLIKPKLLRRPIRTLRVVHPIMRHDAGKPIRMRQNPIRHKPAIAPTQRTLPHPVDERILSLRSIQPLHQIDISLPTPIPIHAIDKRLPIPRRPTRIHHHHHIPTSRHQLRIPPITPRIPPGPLRPPMNQKLHRILLRLIKVRRPHNKSLHLRRLRSLKPK